MALKKKSKKFWIWIVITILIIIAIIPLGILFYFEVWLSWVGGWNAVPPVGYSIYNYPEFKTEYSEEEHKQRILDVMVNTFGEPEDSQVIAGYEVEIIYSFYDNNPEYFLITIEYKGTTASGKYYPNDIHEPAQYITNYRHLVGRIVEDTYTHWHYGEFITGRSPWDFLGYSEAKKYYGNDIFGVETEDGVLQIFDKTKTYNENCLEFMDYYVMRGATKQKLLSVSEQKQIKADTASVSGTIYELYRRESEKFKAVKQ